MTKKFKYSYPKLDHLFLGMDLAYTTARTGLCGLGLKEDRILLVSAPIIDPLSGFRGDLENGVVGWVNGLMKKYRCNRATLALGRDARARVLLIHTLKSDLGFQFYENGDAPPARRLIEFDPKVQISDWLGEGALAAYDEASFLGRRKLVEKTIARFNSFFGEFPISQAEFSTDRHFDSYVRAIAAFENQKDRT
ncbi:MAG: hypothetical protein P4M08_12370 [Oligoflexia bacterium]|nr:hypothetical protein [Oligoflexia bacterium]